MFYSIRILVVALFGFSVFLGYSLVVQHPAKDVIIKIEVAPSSASVQIDGKRAKVGENKVVAGKHVVSASLDGFSSQSQTYSTQSGDNIYSGFVLKSNIAETEDWYTQIPDDQKLAEGISSHLSDYASNESSKENSLLQELPYIYGDGHGGMVTISQGVPVRGSSKSAIYIEAATPQDRREALEWIRSNGHNPADMDIVFVGQLDGDILEEGGQ